MKKPLSPNALLLITGILREVLEERQRQHEKWGFQNHPLVDDVLRQRNPPDPERMAEEYEIPTGDRAKFLCDLRHSRGDGTWADILVEELSEFVEAATLRTNAREELVQVAAVAVAAIEAIDRGITK